MSEAQFTNAVIDFAKYRGWMVAHFRPARTTRGWRTPVQGDNGFPDLVLARDGRVVYAELKVGPNRLSIDQQRWASALPEMHVWRPADLRDTIPDVLR
jgi:hypothetical protein